MEDLMKKMILSFAIVAGLMSANVGAFNMPIFGAKARQARQEKKLAAAYKAECKKAHDYCVKCRQILANNIWAKAHPKLAKLSNVGKFTAKAAFALAVLSGLTCAIMHAGVTHPEWVAAYTPRTVILAPYFNKFAGYVDNNVVMPVLNHMTPLVQGLVQRFATKAATTVTPVAEKVVEAVAPVVIPAA
jgi:hypothetical protein